MKIVNGKLLRFLPFILWPVLSCSDDERIEKIEEVDLQPPVAKIDFSDGVDRIILDGTSSTDADQNTLTFEWVVSNENILVQNNKLGKTYFRIPPGTEETSVDVTLKVRDLNHESVVSVSISVPPLTQIRSYGLGKKLYHEEENTAPYAWYFDQANSGVYSNFNCGPASVTMAAKWADPNFNNSVETARNLYPRGGGWWYTNDIINYLNLNSITNWTIPITSIQVLKEEIDNDNIIILCLDMFYVTFTGEPEYRVHKFYSTPNSSWGHFIVIKGYKVIDDKILFEAYDPYSWDRKYQDQTLKGMNRYYSHDNIETATQLWWDYAIVVSKGASSGKRNAVDVNSIIHMPGR